MSKAAVYVRLNEAEIRALEGFSKDEKVCKPEVIRRMIRVRAGMKEERE